MKYDHHCPWIGACVGEQNHFMFLLCLLFHTLQSVTTFYIVTFHVISLVYQSLRWVQVLRSIKRYIQHVIRSIGALVFFYVLLHSLCWMSIVFPPIPGQCKHYNQIINEQKKMRIFKGTQRKSIWRRSCQKFTICNLSRLKRKVFFLLFREWIVSETLSS